MKSRKNFTSILKIFNSDVNVSFRGERSNPKLFAIRDHMTGNDMVTLVKKEFSKLERCDNLSPAQKEKIRRELTLQRLQKVADMPGMESYQTIDRDRLPKPHHDFLSFLNQSASLESSKTKDILVTWHLPITMQVILVPDALT